ncbi:MAG: 4'-phosphopantetheinyl transferase superfamily protein [Deltaproteobacteria bacterium]|nr:4'-phosphopantetheinyl transferase superfamily protein [Deltaproteobacteria bacterium]
MSVKHRAPASTPQNPGYIAQGTIHTLSGLLPGRFVVFASTRTRRGGRLRLAPMLLRALGRLDSRWRIPFEENALTLRKSTLGSPHLLLGDRQGPSVSFSHGEGRLWAAMCSKGRVGIDVAYPEEFSGDYPFARAFNPEELDAAGAICPDDTARGAALLWSVKEASVKATWAGFNRLDPLEVRVGPPLFREKGVLFEVLADRPILAWARAEAKGWLSVALARP